MKSRKSRYWSPEFLIENLEDEDIVCSSLTDGGIGEEDDFGGSVGGGGGSDEWN